GSIRDYLEMAKSGQERPVMTFADQLPQMFVGPAAYDKPAIALRLLRDVVVGPERFDPAFKEYFRRWAYKHPTPADFFRTIEDGVGEDLSWFWRAWFYTTQQLDQAVDSVTTADSTGVESQIHLRNAGGIPMPVELGLLMDDGSTRRLRLPVEIWYHGERFTAVVPGPGKVNGVVLDPDGVYPDVKRDNNRWAAAGSTP
ncbi:MAG: M1 family peptidase, partial [Gemmatimonadales bacterium]|nr:M1 family peptidase [Gemmatimonadales bacterium]